PISSHCLRSRAEPPASRGYHATGTEIVRPSCNSTISASRVTRTFLAAAFVIERNEEFMPSPQKLCLMLANERYDALQFRRTIAVVVFNANRIEPDLGYLPLTPDVHVRRFSSVARKEEKTIRSLAQ